MNRCPVCGYDGLFEEPFDDVGAPSYEICKSCGTEFGYDDIRTRHSVLREKWIAKGMPWHSRATPAPPDWDPVEQLRQLAATEATDVESKTKRR
jgi:hypothetical protein